MHGDGRSTGRLVFLVRLGLGLGLGLRLRLDPGKHVHIYELHMFSDPIWHVGLFAAFGLRSDESIYL